MKWLAIVCHSHGQEIGWSTVCANSKQKVPSAKHHEILWNVSCTSAWIYGVFQINGTSEISTCKHWKHLPFHTYSRSTFQRKMSWQVLKIAFRSLQIWKFYGGGYPQTALQGLCLPFGTCHNAPPLQKTYLRPCKLAGPVCSLSLNSVNRPQSSLVLYLQVWSQS